MNIITILTLVVTTAYLFYTGVIPSISDSYRTVKHTFIYHLYFILSTALVMMQGIYAKNLVLPYLLSGFFLYAVSVASRFWLKSEGPYHSIFTYIAIGIGFTLTLIRMWPTWGGFATIAWAILGIGGALLLQKVAKSNVTYWQEVWAYLIVFVPIIKA